LYGQDPLDRPRKYRPLSNEQDTMPAEVNNSVITATSLTPRNTPQTAQTEARSRDNTASASTSNPQAVLSSGPESLVRSPDPGTGAQGAENSSQDAGAQQQPNPQNAGNAVGQNVDVSI
tara:strand:- start:570 stop:926 length:357 start_codon:yes stop_codon:yes gene_type:complete